MALISRKTVVIVLISVLVAGLAVLCLKAVTARGSRVLITISKDTTRITGPLREDGYVDYLAALNQRYSRGVTPENNAAVPFLRAMGPAEIAPRHRSEYFGMLGIPPLPEEGDYFVTLDKYAERLKAGEKPATKPGEDVGNVLLRQEGQAMKRPWSEKEFPALAGWLAANEKPLAMLVEASKRPRRYDPLISGNGSVYWASCPAMTQSREAAWALTARAMLRVNEGRLDEAWDDLLACHRLARLAAQGPTLVELLVGTNADAMACAGDQGMLQHVRLTAAQALKMRDDLAKLSPISELVEKLDVTERFSYLDCAGMAARQGVDALTDLTGDSESSGATRWLTGVALGRVDWDQVLRMGNSWYDRLADAYRKPTWTERQKAHREIDGELGAMIRDLDAAEDWKWLTPSALFSPRKSVTQRIGLRLASVLIPGPAVADAEDRGAMQFELTRLAFALAAYRADHGSYPAKLADLAPKYVAEVPKDIFSAADLHYKQERGGYLLYSVGPNGKDDGGKGRDDRREPEDFNQDWDDIAVRVPGPAAEK